MIRLEPPSAGAEHQVNPSTSIGLAGVGSPCGGPISALLLPPRRQKCDSKFQKKTPDSLPFRHKSFCNMGLQKSNILSRATENRRPRGALVCLGTDGRTWREGWGRAGGRQDGPVSDVAVGCAASRVLKTEDFVQVSAKRDPAACRHRSDPGSDTSGLRANENLSVQFPRGQSVRRICTHEQQVGRNVSSLVGRPSSRAGARACAPGAACDRLGKRRKGPYSRWGGAAARWRTAQRQLAGGNVRSQTDAALAHHVDCARSL